jgi:predicted nucleic acid-binding protein
MKAGKGEDAVSILELLGIHTIPFPADASQRLARLRATTSLKMPDCCVLLAAEQVRGSLATFDGELRQAARHRRLGVLPEAHSVTP